MKDDLISRQAAIEALGKRPMVWVGSDYELGARNQYDADVLALETVPSAQPEIIRSKDCIYFTPEKSGDHWNVCRFFDAPKTADGYCNDAERKEE